MTLHVWWLSLHENVPARGYFDQAMLEAVFDGSLWPPAAQDVAHHIGPGAVPDSLWPLVVIPASAHRDDTAALVELLEPYQGCATIVLTADEGSYFPAAELTGVGDVWVQSARSDRHHPDAYRWLPVGWPPGTPEVAPAEVRDLDWFFAGQVTNDRRRAAAKALQRIEGGALSATEGFLQGEPHGAYMATLARAKVAPCPGGIITPDTFRVWEALEAGCVPIADRRAGEWDVPPDYWETITGSDPAPFPVIDDWWKAGKVIARQLEAWPTNANRLSAWWVDYKRTLARAVAVQTISPVEPSTTVIIPTSPIPSHPDDGILSETLASVRAVWPTAEVILCVDGVRAEQAGMADAYQSYVRRVLDRRHPGVLPLLFEGHRHQAQMTAAALERVRTPLVAFVEHDTPLAGDIDLAACEAALLADRVDLIRFHHEAHVLDEHRYLMVGRPEQVSGCPLWRTVQWSQRPHLARTAFYRRILADHFTANERTMIEDRMFGIIDPYAHDHGNDSAWRKWRMAIYHPDGNILRSRHLDGRGDQPKFVGDE